MDAWTNGHGYIYIDIYNNSDTDIDKEIDKWTTEMKRKQEKLKTMDNNAAHSLKTSTIKKKETKKATLAQFENSPEVKV